MRDKHIISLLDSGRFGTWSVADSLLIETHIAECADCLRAYSAAKAAAALIQARVAEVIEPSPFFSTRVMALIREQQNAPSWIEWATMWKTARGLVGSLIAVVVLLAGLTVFTPAPNNGDSLAVLAPANYSTEGVVFGDDTSNADESPSNEQVVDVVFTPEETDASSQK